MKSVFVVVGLLSVFVLYWVFDEGPLKNVLYDPKVGENFEAEILRTDLMALEDAQKGPFQPLPALPAFDREKARLGHDLFRDVRFSKSNTVSCSSCHSLQSYGADDKAFSIGVNGRLGDANSPTVYNSSLNFRMFWDGRAATLAEQIEGPVHNPKELASNWAEVTAKLKLDPGYSDRFQNLYGRPLHRDDVIDAILTFEKALLTPDSPFDRYLRGEKSALSEAQHAGLLKFQSYGCVACHQGVNLGGNMYQTLGIMGDFFGDQKLKFPSDVGRFAITKDPKDLHVFRVPSLRNVGQTAPYFHAGQVATLDQAVLLMAKYQLGRELSDRDVSDLVSFLHALTGRRPDILTEEKSAEHAMAD